MLAIIVGIYLLSIPRLSELNEHTSVPRGGVTALAVEAYLSNVTISTGGDEFAFRLTGKSLADENYRAHLTVAWDEKTPGRLVVRETRSAFDLRFEGHDKLSLEITLPEGYNKTLSVDNIIGNVDMGRVACHTWSLTLGSGNATVKDAFFATSLSPGFDKLGSGTVNTGKGKAVVENVVNDSVNVYSTSGEISATGCTAGNFRANSISGTIGITDLTTGGLKISTSAGKVNAAMKGLTAEAFLDSMSGDIDLTFPSGLALDIKASSASGSVKNDYPSAEGAIPVDAATLTGNIVISER